VAHHHYHHQQQQHFLCTILEHSGFNWESIPSALSFGQKAVKPLLLLMLLKKHFSLSDALIPAPRVAQNLEWRVIVHDVACM
jgi:hypothetical protein